MINETLVQWFEALGDEESVVFGGTWANAWSPVWEVEKTVPESLAGSENTQAGMHGDACHHG